MNVDGRPPTENPFSSRYVRPGALPFFFPPGDSAEAIVARFLAADRRGAIVGPHGSGKSTLLEELLPRLHDRGCEPRVFVLRNGERRLSRRFAEGLVVASVIVVDGFEQLGWWSRGALFCAAHRNGCGLLLTSHRPVRGVPSLFTSMPTAESTIALAERLLSGPLAGPITAAEVRRQFDEHRGNIREVLFGLYDLYESQRL